MTANVPVPGRTGNPHSYPPSPNAIERHAMTQPPTRAQREEAFDLITAKLTGDAAKEARIFVQQRRRRAADVEALILRLRARPWPI